MPKSDKDLSLAEDYDKKALEHLKKVLEWGHSALDAPNPEEREKFLGMARRERQAAVDALTDANIALWL